MTDVMELMYNPKSTKTKATVVTLKTVTPYHEPNVPQTRKKK